MANPVQPATKPTEQAVCDYPSELQSTQDETHSPQIESSKKARGTVDVVDLQWNNTAVSSAQPFLHEISRAFDCLRRYYVDSFLPSRTPRKTSISPRASNSFTAEALVLLCEDFEMCPHPFPPSFVCKVYSSLTNVSDSPADLLARSLAVLACSGFRYSGGTRAAGCLFGVQILVCLTASHVLVLYCLVLIHFSQNVLAGARARAWLAWLQIYYRRKSSNPTL